MNPSIKEYLKNEKISLKIKLERAILIKDFLEKIKNNKEITWELFKEKDSLNNEVYSFPYLKRSGSLINLNTFLSYEEEVVLSRYHFPIILKRKEDYVLEYMKFDHITMELVKEDKCIADIKNLSIEAMKSIFEEIISAQKEYISSLEKMVYKIQLKMVI